MGLMNKACAFTGHRPSKLPWRYNETDSRCVALKMVLTEQITALIEAGVTQFLSGMAEGTDIFCSEIVLALREKNPKIKLHCILPCTAQAEKWSVSSQELYRSILGRADSVVYVSRDYHEKCILDRNRFLVEHAATLLAVYNGEQRGGTAATIRYAQKMSREIMVINPITLLVTYGGI
ncbi:SLOG family protein [uncultured Oscillibacter sp.]|uniref:SLOG family protein n=1 Tax=uncultured Oscillibacter sp. TaxID=876091 RepID=UPI00262B7C55|nr:SLOG family protein [uncultured Oscillibacter sp.]